MTNVYVYDAFGNLISNSGTVENDYQFAGEQYDENLEQYYLRQRYYDAGIGRFSRRDVYEGRLGEPITLHKYLYTRANPVNRIDPSGLSDLSLGGFLNTYHLVGILASLYYVTPLVPKIVFATIESIDDFLDIYAPYFAARGKKKHSSPEDNGEDNEDNESSQRHGGGKNAQHGKAENQPSQEKQLRDLEEQLKEPGLKKSEKSKIRTKINNIRKQIARRKKGEQHSQQHKK